MSVSRTRQGIRNAKWGMLMQGMSILTRFITATVFVKILGISYNGLNGLFTEVIAVLSLAELGVGSAIVYHLYRPLAEDDTETLRRLMGLFRTAYHIIGCSILGIGLLLTPFIHKIVKDVPFDLSYIRLVFVLFVLQTASSYFFAYKRSLLNADQRNYIVSITSIGFNLLTAVLSCVVLYITRSYIPYLIVQIVVSFSVNIAISMVADRKYPFLKQLSQATPEERTSVLSNIKHIFVGTLSGKLTTSTDNILISVLVSTMQSGIYVNYALVTNSLINLFRKAAESVTGGFGNLMVTSEPKKIAEVYRRTAFFFFCVGFVLALGVFSVLTPFVKLWLGGLDEAITLSDTVLAVCALNMFLFIAREPLWKMVQVSGLFAIDKYISIAGSVVNLIISVIFGKLWGMMGIFLGTSCTLIIQFILKLLLLYRKKLELEPRRALVQFAQFTLLILGGMVLCAVLNQVIVLQSVLAEFICHGLLSVLISVGAIVLFYARSDEFTYWRGIVNQILFKRGDSL